MTACGALRRSNRRNVPNAVTSSGPAQPQNALPGMGGTSRARRVATRALVSPGAGPTRDSIKSARRGRRLRAAGESALPPLGVLAAECRRWAVRLMRTWPREAATSGAVTHTNHRDLVQVKRAYKFRAYPTRPQEGRAARLLADHCDLYNAALEERREAWRMRRVSVSYGVQSAQLREIRKADPGGHGRHSFTAQQQTLRRLNTVFTAFYQRARAGKAGYPRFKPHSRFDQVMFVAGDGAKGIQTSGESWERAAFQAVGAVKVRQHRPVCGMVKTLQLKREHRRWYVIVVAEAEPVPLPATGREIGIDVGVNRFLTTSDGEIVANPRFLAASSAVIADLQ